MTTSSGGLDAASGVSVIRLLLGTLQYLPLQVELLKNFRN